MATAQDFEKLGVFFLGRPYDLAAVRPKAGWLLYQAKDLVTHAVCVGMTGSGKTGLCIGLLEEAAIDGIPAIAIDPKGDLGNLLLTFPDLEATDFMPWINEDDARMKGLTPGEYAAQQAERWKAGLASWEQGGERIRRLREGADVVIYTPGSEAGMPVSILTSFAAPPGAILDDPELLQERITTTATSLLGLIGLSADPITSREHILLSTLLGAAWRQRRDLDLTSLIHDIQTPPVSRIGVVDLESFYPSKDRFTLAMQVNNLLAAPGFASWMAGVPLDVNTLLYTAEGKPRLAIFSIAHLTDRERMFCVSLLLNQVLGWARSQSGTTTLRAILYMDEIFGYLPPVANPPSKGPLLTLLKQARAYGVGVVLATQNPVDLDYKALSNAGTWFIGRLQTERDRARVLEGLEGASSGGTAPFDRRRLEHALAGLKSRMFLMKNVHDETPEIFETRWTLSYLRGPLTRTQITTLMDPLKRRASAPGQASRPAVQPLPDAERLPTHGVRPVLPPDVPQQFIPFRGPRPSASHVVYQPVLLGSARIRFAETKAGYDVHAEWTATTAIRQGPIPVSWDEATILDLPLAALEAAPEEDARFMAVPAVAAKANSYALWQKDLVAWLHRTQTIRLFASPTLKQVSRPGESEREFRIRLLHLAHEERDRVADRLRRKYSSRMATLEGRIRRAEQALARESAQVTHSHIQTAISVGATLLGAFLGRKPISSSTIGKATTAIRGAGRTAKEARDVTIAKEALHAIQQDLAALNAQFERELEDATTAIDPHTEPFETVTLRPMKQDIAVRLLTLAWLPVE